MKKLIQNSMDYYITSEGDVYRKGKKLRTGNPNDNWYKKVRIRYINGDLKDKLVHRLVAETFIPNPENKPFVNHKNGIKSDNRLENLEWVTAYENQKHAIESGLLPKSWEYGNSEHSEEKLREVLKLLEDGLRYKEIAEITGVSYSQVINLRSSHRHSKLVAEYKVPPPRSKTMSYDTVYWICEMIDQGLKDKEIADLAKNKSVNQTKIRFIRTGYTFTDISKHFNFRKT